MVVVGSTTLQRKDSAAVHAAVSTIAQTARVQSGCGEEWRVLNVLHRVSDPQGPQSLCSQNHWRFGSSITNGFLCKDR